MRTFYASLSMHVPGLQVLQTAASAYMVDAGSYDAAQKLLTNLQSLKEAAESRPRVWLEFVAAQLAVLPFLVKGLLHWQFAVAMERVLQLLTLLLPAPVLPKEGLKCVLPCALRPVPCPALPCPALPCPALPCPAPPRPALPCLALPRPALPCPV